MTTATVNLNDPFQRQLYIERLLLDIEEGKEKEAALIQRLNPLLSDSQFLEAQKIFHPKKSQR